MTNTSNTPTSKAQKIFDSSVQSWAVSQADDYVKMFPEDNVADQIADMLQMLPYSFHNKTTVAVDSTLFDILSYGHADYGFGKSIYEKIHGDLKKAGYYIENDGAGVWNFVKETV